MAKKKPTKGAGKDNASGTRGNHQWVLPQGLRGEPWLARLPQQRPALLPLARGPPGADRGSREGAAEPVQHQEPTEEEVQEEGRQGQAGKSGRPGQPCRGSPQSTQGVGHS